MPVQRAVLQKVRRVHETARRRLVQGARQVDNLPLVGVAQHALTLELCHPVVELRQLGLVDPRREHPGLSRRAGESIQLPDGLAHLSRAGIADAPSVTAEELLSVHLAGRRDADGAVKLAGFQQYLLNEGDTLEHVNLTVGRVRKLFDACGFVFWKDLAVDGAGMLLMTQLGAMRQRGKRPLGSKTINYYLRAVKSFCNWFVTVAERAPMNPLAKLKRVRVTEAEAKVTRDLDPDELAWVVYAAEAATSPRFGMGGDERALLYRFAYETGIRPGQIAPC